MQSYELFLFTVALIPVQFGQAQGESHLNFAFADPGLAQYSGNSAADQSASESNGLKARINRSPRIERPYNWPRRGPPLAPINSYSHLSRYNRQHPDYQEPSYKAIDKPTSGREEADFWPTPMQHHVEHNAKELPKMFYLKKTYQDRRPSPHRVHDEPSSWRQSSRIADNPSGTRGSFHGNRDGTYRLPGPRPQSPSFRQLVTQTERPTDRPPSVQVYYDYRDQQQRPFHHEQIESDLSSAIANFVQQHLEETSGKTSSRWSREPPESDIEVYVRFIDRRKRKSPR